MQLLLLRDKQYIMNSKGAPKCVIIWLIVFIRSFFFKLTLIFNFFFPQFIYFCNCLDGAILSETVRYVSRKDLLRGNIQIHDY